MRAAKAIHKLRPGAEFSLDGAEINWETDAASGVTYATNVIYHTEVQPITKEEYDAILPEVIAEEPKLYQFERSHAYPSLTELADAIYWQAQGDNTKMEAYLAKVQAVKEAFPKQ
jgi:hypothetical protein